MPVPARPSAAARGALALACTVVGTAATLALAGPAAAEPPLDLPGPVTDLAGVLSPAQEQEVEAALDRLDDATPYQLFVVYVDSFDGLGNEQWAADTAAASGLGRDDILLAVAVEDRRYQVSVQDDIDLTDRELTSVEQRAIEPALGDDDWAGAATAAADAYADVPGSRGAGMRTFLAVVGVLALLAALVAGGVWLVRRRRAAAELDALDDSAALALVAADDAVTAAAQEIGFAEARYGTAAVAPFAAALGTGRSALTEAFRVRQLLDDDEPDTAAERRTMSEAVLAGCARVHAVIAEQRSAFDQLRDLHENAPRDLAAARDEAARTTERVEAARVTTAGLTQRFAATALGDVAGAADRAAGGAAAAAAQATSGLAVLDTDRVAAVEHAQTAWAQLRLAAADLDALDQRAAELEAAPRAIAAISAEVDADLADAARLGAGDVAVATVADAARSAQARAAAPEQATDPLAALAGLQAAERDLDRLLDPLRAAEAARQHAIERLPQALQTARTRITSATATIARDRSDVGSAARTRLAEAERLATQADAASGADPVGALRDLRAAAERAEQAERAARSDIAAAQRRRDDAAGFGSSGGWSGGSSSGWSWGSSSSSGSRSRASWSGRSSSGRSSSSRSSSRSSSGRSSGATRSSSSSRRSGGGRRGGGGRF